MRRQVQHRMRPEISTLIRNTVYPDLLDHPTTEGRERVHGVDRNVLFLSHSRPEVHDQDAEALGSKSKINVYEAEMVVGISQVGSPRRLSRTLPTTTAYMCHLR
eukprot:1194844-Prorocentrum_minimum.AAC.8